MGLKAKETLSATDEICFGTLQEAIENAGKFSEFINEQRLLLMDLV